ncbi:hypothetical protein ElyMa_006880900 [Elysia marginata]|uniref:Uncharacterized protein n=1 Tax=Elysia marginata TaxID=1093978 RepID=A0AAV4JGJ2_9GAST|nr:hypothetical protein ElyMa_006880900 [Elysia marginata]
MATAQPTFDSIHISLITVVTLFGYRGEFIADKNMLQKQRVLEIFYNRFNDQELVSCHVSGPAQIRIRTAAVLSSKGKVFIPRPRSLANSCQIRLARVLTSY